MNDQRKSIETALTDFESYASPEAAMRLFGTVMHGMRHRDLETTEHPAI